jgi:hypothetical protein
VVGAVGPVPVSPSPLPAPSPQADWASKLDADQGKLIGQFGVNNPELDDSGLKAAQAKDTEARRWNMLSQNLEKGVADITGKELFKPEFDPNYNTNQVLTRRKALSDSQDYAKKQLEQQEAVRGYLVQKQLQDQLSDPNSGYSQSVKGALYNVLAPPSTYSSGPNGTIVENKPNDAEVKRVHDYVDSMSGLQAQSALAQLNPYYAATMGKERSALQAQAALQTSQVAYLNAQIARDNAGYTQGQHKREQDVQAGKDIPEFTMKPGAIIPEKVKSDLIEKTAAYNQIAPKVDRMIELYGKSPKLMSQADRQELVELSKEVQRADISTTGDKARSLARIIQSSMEAPEGWLDSALQQGGRWLYGATNGQAGIDPVLELQEYKTRKRQEIRNLGAPYGEFKANGTYRPLTPGKAP